MFDFSGKVLVLSGANGGITRAVARTFYRLGARMLLTDLDEAGVAAFGEDLDPLGERVVTARVDVTRSDEVNAAALHCRERFGHADHLVTGAGLYLDQFVETMTDEQWRQTIGINLDGVFYFCRAFPPLLRDGGAIVNISSVAGHRGSYQHAHYAAAKAAVLGFSRSLMHELAPRNIRVNCVAPGPIDTPMVVPLLKARGPQLLEATPLRRIGQPEEVARVVAFLCSDWASFITGETVHINGGLHVAG
jgi:3-oxoacyl-[acyl-carrier protein] reductase